MRIRRRIRPRAREGRAGRRPLEEEIRQQRHAVGHLDFAVVVDVAVVLTAQEATAAEIVTMTIRITNVSGAVQGAGTASMDLPASAEHTLYARAIASPASTGATVYVVGAVLSSAGNVDALQGGIEAWELF